MAIEQLINCGCSFAHGYNGEDLTDSEYKVIKFPGLPYLKRSGYKSVGYYLAESKNLDLLIDKIFFIFSIDIIYSIYLN